MEMRCLMFLHQEKPNWLISGTSDVVYTYILIKNRKHMRNRNIDVCSVTICMCYPYFSPLGRDLSDPTSHKLSRVKAGPRFGDSLQTLILPLKYPGWLLSWDLGTCIPSIPSIPGPRWSSLICAEGWRLFRGSTHYGCLAAPQCHSPCFSSIFGRGPGMWLFPVIEGVWCSLELSDSEFWPSTAKPLAEPMFFECLLLRGAAGPMNLLGHQASISPGHQPSAISSTVQQLIGAPKRVQSQRFTTQLRKNPWRRRALGKKWMRIWLVVYRKESCQRMSTEHTLEKCRF